MDINNFDRGKGEPEVGRLYLAPLKGLTDYVFRSTFARHWTGLDVAMAPFISSRRDKKFKPAHIRDVLPENNPGLPVIPQILSHTPEDFVALANYLSEWGHTEVNWNLGCPFPAVAKKKRGAGLLPYTERIQRFLDDARPALKVRLSLKIRLGWADTDDFWRLLPILNQADLSQLIIHPRTGLQRYEGTVDLAALDEIVPAVNCPVVYNGDIRTLSDFSHLTRRYQTIRRWMIGRGCLENPFLPEMIKTNPTIPLCDRIDQMQQFHDALFAAYNEVLYGPAHVFNKMKGLWKYYAVGLTDCPRLMKKIKKANRPAEYLQAVERFFEAQRQMAADPAASPQTAP